MISEIEVELRGSLTKMRAEELYTFFLEHGEFVGVKERVLIDYSTFLRGEEISDRTRDIRLRVTNKIPEIIVKIGKWGGSDQREELSILAKPGEFDMLVRIFAAMGFKKGMLCVRKTQVYRYRDIEFAIVEVPDHSFYFEAEKIIHTLAEKDSARKEIEIVCEELALKTFSDEEFFTYIETLNRDANEMFDFDRDYKDNYFKERFNL